nr:hypothetical protein [Lachnospiraceae bacterium]
HDGENVSSVYDSYYLRSLGNSKLTSLNGQVMFYCKNKLVGISSFYHSGRLPKSIQILPPYSKGWVGNSYEYKRVNYDRIEVVPIITNYKTE